jgi:hypothetical protein
MVAGTLALGAIALVVSIGHGKAGAKEPVEVSVRPDARTPLSAAAFGAVSKSDSGTGTLKGVVTFKGKPPVLKPLVKKGDPALKEEDRKICAAEDLPDHSLVVNEKADNGVANVVVYLQKPPEGYKAPPPPSEPAVLDQKGCHFIPHVLVLRCKQELLIKSGDPIPHNTHITPVRNSGFNKVIGADDRQGVAYEYTKPESVPIPVNCDLHKWMKAYQLPLEHPFAAVTDDEGKFEIDGLPPGKYTFFVWHEIPGYLNRKLAVEIKAGNPTEEKLSFTAAQFKVGK